MEDTLSKEMYREHILDHYRYPHNFGKLEKADKEHMESNLLCGDNLTIQLLLKDNTISDIRFSGSGCAISIAAASLLTDKIKNMNVDDVNMLKATDLLELLKIPISQPRLKCALLSLETIKGALAK